MNRALFITALLACCIVACSCTTASYDTTKSTGTVIFLPIEGGFYGIKGDDGRNYDPVNLPDEFRKDGLRVRYDVRELRDRASVHMWGTIAEIVRIEKL
jgi:hypothetical protein